MKIEKRTVVVACFLIVAASSSPLFGGVTLDAVDRGNYEFGGGHSPDNTNYIAGDITSKFQTFRRNFFVFDLDTVDLPIVSATLRVYLTSYSSFDASETWTLYDVTSPFDILLTDFGGVEQWEDLGSGVEYGAIDLVDDDEDAFITITLNAAAIDSLNAARTSGIENRWAVGGALTTLDNDSSTIESLFSSSDLRPLSDTQLLITTIPAPGALALLGLAAIKPTRRRR